MGEHPVEGQKATGRPRVEVFIEVAPFETLDGIEAREKNQMLKENTHRQRSAVGALWGREQVERTHETPVSASSVTQTPPPAAANPAPYLNSAEGHRPSATQAEGKAKPRETRGTHDASSVC
jgi:hypothetical protein